MSGFTALLLSYLLGGVTFIPLVVSAVFLHAYLNLPGLQDKTNHAHHVAKDEKRDEELEEKLSRRSQEPDVASGSFAVCREFVPGGVNGKPPERISPRARETIIAESPSVYQTMYRSIFERNKAQAPTLDAGDGGRKTQNTFFVALRCVNSEPEMHAR